VNEARRLHATSGGWGTAGRKTRRSRQQQQDRSRTMPPWWRTKGERKSCRRRDRRTIRRDFGRDEKRRVRKKADELRLAAGMGGKCWLLGLHTLYINALDLG